MVNILSIRVFAPELIFVGIVISGRRKFDIIISKKLNVSLRFETLSRSKLKSPEINIFLFSNDRMSVIFLR